VDSEFKVGTMWAVYVKPEFRRKGVATELVERCIKHWHSIGCKSAVLIYASDAGRRIYERQGFAKDNLLFLDLLPSKSVANSVPETKNYDFVVTPAGAKSDLVVINNWRKVWLDRGKSSSALRKDVGPATQNFIERARNKLEFQSFVARDSAGNVIGSVACQTWEGPLPLVIEQRTFKLGSIWGLYVEPESRGQGVGKDLLRHCNEHLASIGCKRAITLATSQAAADWLRHCGFDPSNAMTMTLNGTAPEVLAANSPAFQLPSNVTVEAVVDLRNAHKSLADSETQHLSWLLRANANQLRALDLGWEVETAVVGVQKIHGLWMDPGDNWFTRNVKRFGKGFDMEMLGKDKALLASKFDRLSPNYEAWTLGNRSVVEDWVASTLRSTSAEGSIGPQTHLVDVACGAGLMGHTIRMLGFRGMMSGVDVSSGMVDEARGRSCYDALWTEDVREGVSVDSGAADVVLCTGAMELLNPRASLNDFHRMLAPRGQLWVSFQTEQAQASTAHQHVTGMARAAIERLVLDSGFEIKSAVECPAAFYTPSPAQDGSLMPVPYLFMLCIRAQ